MKKNLNILFLSFLFYSCLFYSCQFKDYGLEQGFFRKYPVNNRAGSLKTLNLKRDEISQENYPDAYNKIFTDKKYSFMVITDVHIGSDKYGNEDENIKSFLDKVKSLPELPAFCLGLGDFAEHGKNEEFTKYNQEIILKLDELGIRSFSVLGNHDLYNSGYENFSKILNPKTSFYKFETPSISFYGLDSASASLGDQQLTALKNAFNFDIKPKIIFTHVPLFAESKFYFVFQDSAERNRIISLFAENNVQLFLVGHTHERHISNLGFSEENFPALFKSRAFFLIHIDENDFENMVTGIEEIYF